MPAEAFDLLAPSHIIFAAFCIGISIYLPRIFIGSSQRTITIAKYGLAFLMLSHEVLDPFLKVTYFGEVVKDSLPLHMCAFSSICISIYLLGGHRMFFLFAFFWGIAGAGMSVLTPDTLTGFPSFDYLNHMYGHTLILLGVSFVLTLTDERPYLDDYFATMLWSTFGFLPAMYTINFALDTNYWYLLEKPYGENIMQAMPDAPYHIVALIPVAWLLTYLIYVPLQLKDRNA